MPLKTYTVTATGMKSNGNDLDPPFTVTVPEMAYSKDDNAGSDNLIVHTCVRNSSGDICVWDELEAQGYNNGRKIYTSPAPAMTTSKNNDLSNSLEDDLDLAAGQGNWS